LLFTLNHLCAKLRIMDVKLHCDLFNTLVRSIASYACEVWVDSKKIEAIEVVYRGFFKSLLRVQKTTNTSIMNTLHGDKRCYTITVWARSLETASWERHGKPSSLCLLRERNVQLDPWENVYLKISPKRWQVFCLQFNCRWKWRLNLQWLMCSRWGLFNRRWEQFLGQRTYIRPI
jgi:hypothetical protein